MKKLLTYGAIITLTICFTIGGYIAYLSWQTYQFLKNPASFSFGVFANDTSLGYRLMPASRGIQFIPGRRDLAIEIDSLGFRQRQTKHNTDSSLRPVLFIGDSYSFGDCVVADSTFAYLTGDATSRTVYNAACGGYGLTQFLLQADKYLPMFQPGAVVFQLSPWSAPRCTLAYVNRMIEKTPTPYFIAQGDSIVGIAKPYYQSEIFRITGAGVFDKYRRSRSSLLDFCGFYREYGLAVFLPQIKNEFILFLKKTCRAAPKKATDIRLIEEYYLTRIAAFHEQYKCKTLILLIGMGEEESKAFRAAHSAFLSRHSDLIMIDAEKVMRAKLNTRSIDSFEKEYMIWGGDPPHIVDRHYNEKANLIIANELASAIR